MELTVSQYAKQKGVSPQSVYKRIKKGTLKHRKVFGKTIVKLKANAR